MATDVKAGTATRRNRHPHDDAPDTQDAFLRIAALGECAEKARLTDEVTRQWLPLAHRLAAKYRGRGESLEDLKQVAALGLVKAVTRYDTERGTAFASYAVPTIDGELKRHFRDCMWTVHVPRRVQELRRRVRLARQELAAAGVGNPPRPTQRPRPASPRRRCGRATRR